VKEASKLKTVAVEDATKRFNESAARSKEMSQLYEVVKTEKNKYVNLIQASKQRAFEMQDKIRILSSEVEILRGELVVKEKECAKKKLEALNSISSRDMMRQDANKHLLIYREHREVVEQNIATLETLQNNIESQERQLSMIKGQYEKAIQDRNNRASQLVERNDELCLLYERFNIQEQIMMQAEMEMQGREEDIKRLQIQTKELDREISILRSTLSKSGNSIVDLRELQDELASIQLVESYLSKRVEDPFYAECNAILNARNEDEKSKLSQKCYRLLCVRIDEYDETLFN
jgi:chromosome segregation ATPase